MHYSQLCDVANYYLQIICSSLMTNLFQGVNVAKVCPLQAVKVWVAPTFLHSIAWEASDVGWRLRGTQGWSSNVCSSAVLWILSQHWVDSVFIDGVVGGGVHGTGVKIDSGPGEWYWHIGFIITLAQCVQVWRWSIFRSWVGWGGWYLKHLILNYEYLKEIILCHLVWGWWWCRIRSDLFSLFSVVAAVSVTVEAWPRGAGD